MQVSGRFPVSGRPARGSRTQNGLRFEAPFYYQKADAAVPGFQASSPVRYGDMELEKKLFFSARFFLVRMNQG